jgi:hypothetical protein
VIYHFPKARWTATYSKAWLRIENDDKAFYPAD